MCITSISIAPKVDYPPDIIGSKTKAGNGSSAIVPKPHHKNHNGSREDEQQNGNDFVETMLGIVFLYGFSATAVYLFNPVISDQGDSKPYDKLYHRSISGKPISEKPR